MRLNDFPFPFFSSIWYGKCSKIESNSFNFRLQVKIYLSQKDSQVNRVMSWYRLLAQLTRIFLLFFFWNFPPRGIHAEQIVQEFCELFASFLRLAPLKCRLTHEIYENIWNVSMTSDDTRQSDLCYFLSQRNNLENLQHNHTSVGSKNLIRIIRRRLCFRFPQFSMGVFTFCDSARMWDVNLDDIKQKTRTMWRKKLINYSW